MQLEQISLADSRIIYTQVNLKDHSINIFSSSGYYIPERRILGEIRISLKGWSEFIIKKYISDDPSGLTTEMVLKPYEEMETFEFIQEIKFNDKMLSLSGFSKESKTWIVYEFKETKSEVEQLS
jgi:hypothetical protein